MENFTLIMVLIAFFIILLVYVIKTFVITRNGEIKNNLFYLKESVMNKTEKTFFDILKKELGSDYNIFSKIRIEDFVGVKKTGAPKNELFGLRGRIKSRHVDFLLCDNLMKPVMAIELDGSSHKSQKMIERDNFINGLYSDVGLPIKHVRVGSKFFEEINDIKKELLGNENIK